ncbi:MAG: sel1 repeat family protein [Nitrospirae bacterium]|nr:sel1 repeat family protein [Nitrospirota bacterium]
MRKLLASLVFLLLLSGCLLPGTYFDPSDEYVRGLRWFDRGAFEQAKNYWVPLANAGDCDAQFRLGTLYFLGAGVPQSDETARQWLLASANQGQAFAQGLLAVMHAHDTVSIGTVAQTVVFDCTLGCGVERNIVEAYKWASLSANFSIYDGHRENVKNMIVKYSQSLKPEQIVEVNNLIKDWKPSPSQCKQRKLL